jgi:uncharacterized FlaG/YvyC family protein
MEVSALNRIDAASPGSSRGEFDRNEVLRNAFATVRTLNARNVPDREFAIVRDPESHRFVIRVMDRATGDVVDQFPPEDILKMLSQFDLSNEANQEPGK